MASAAPSVQEYVNHPSYPSVASFVLAFVFVSALYLSVQLPLSLFRLLNHALFGRGRRIPTISVPNHKVQSWLASTTSLSLPSNPVLNNLSLGLTVCFGLASVAQFGSLLVFSIDDLPACAFLVAWAGIATQTAKLLGLLNLGLDLRRLGALKWEFYLFSTLLGGAFVVMFVSNALSVGRLMSLSNSPTDAICVRERHIGTAAATVALNVVLEIYCVARTMYFLVPGFLYPRHKVQALFDIRVTRSLSLLALDIAVAPQMFVFFGVLADTIPSSLITVIVLAAFSQHSPFSSIPPTASIPFTRPGSAYSRSTIEIRKMPSTHSLEHIPHPFAANALLDPTPETEDWPASAISAPQFPEPTLIRNLSYRSSNRLSAPPAVVSRRRVSALSEGDSDVSRSVRNAVLGFAFRSKDVTRGVQSTLPTRSAKAELILLTKSGKPNQSLPMSPITPVSQQPHIEITPAHDDNINNSPSIDSPLSAPSRPSALPSPRVSDITSLNSSSTSRKGALSILTSTTSNSDPDSVRLQPSRSRSVSDHRSSLHFTPTTPAARSHSHHASTDSGEWRYDTYLVPGHELKRASSYVSRETEGHSTSSSFAIGTLSSPQQESHPPGPPPQSQRFSMTILPPADDDLSIVYEASHEESDSLIPPSRLARPHTLTFGQPPPVLTVDLDNLAFSDVIERAERSATYSVAGETTDAGGIREDMFVAGGIGRSIATPVGGVPEDVDNQLGNCSGSGSGSDGVSRNRPQYPQVLISAVPFSSPPDSNSPKSLAFEHRHLHSVTNSGRILFSDVKPNPFNTESLQDNEPLHISTVPISVYRPSSSESFMQARRRSRPSVAHDLVYGNGYSYILPLDDDYRFGNEQLTWIERIVEGPDVTDRETLWSLAKMTRNAYIDVSGGASKEWYELDGYNTSFPFGWEEDADGLRGHVFVTGDNSTVIISIKGTSLTFLPGGGEPTSKRDKLNDNLLFSCCCAAIDFTWTTVCPCSLSIFRNLCNQTCLEESLLDDDLFYSLAVDLYNNVSIIYPNATIWTIGHSLGGAVASLVAVTFGIPAVTFEAPGERMAAQRLRLPLPPSTQHVTHVYHTADPIAMGTCNGVFSPCNFAGYAMESSCHLGQTIVYDTVTELGWAVDVRTHPIKVIVEKLLANKWAPKSPSGLPPQPEDDPVPEAKPQEDCVECYRWDFA